MEIKRYLALFWRWAWLVVLGTVVAGGTAFLISNNTTPVYQATSHLLIDEAPGSAGGNDYSVVLLEQRLAQTYVEIINTRPVREETIERLALPVTPDQLAEMVSVSALPETQIITISVEDIDRQRAATIANTIGEVFIAQNQARENLRYAEPIINWQSRIDEIGDEIESLEIEINAFGATEVPEEQAALSRLETQLKEAQLRYTEAFNNLNELRVSQAKESSNLVQIETAQPPLFPIRPQTFTNTLLAAVAGAILAIGVVFLIEYLDDTIKSPQEIAQDTNLPTLGAIAIIKNIETTGRLVTARSPRDPISEAYRVLRTNLSFSAVDETLTSFLVTSSSPSEGKSTTAANLAVVMAQTGKRVIMVDADLRRPIQHRIFDVTNNQGLTTAILDNKTPVNYHLQRTKIPGLSILTSGPIPPNPAELLNSQRMAQVLDALKHEADLIVFDTPPTLTVADGSILAPRVDGCLLVIESHNTRRATLVQTVERLLTANANIYGVVMNRLNPTRSSYYQYYYYYEDVKTYGSNSRKGRKRRGQDRWLPGFNRR